MSEGIGQKVEPRLGITCDSEETTKVSSRCSNNKLFSEQHEVFQLENNSPSEFNSLDECLDKAQQHSADLFLVSDLLRGQDKPPAKKQKTKDVRPMVFVRFNSRLGKAKPVTLKCLLDTGASASIIAQKHAQKL